jgi:cytidylate kinase
MTIITMSRQVGTCDEEIAHGVCEALGLEQIGPPDDEVFTKPVADRHALDAALGEGASFRERMRMGATGMRYQVMGRILEAAMKGNILVRGMGGTSYLREVPYVLSVRIWAPMEYRVKMQLERWEKLDHAEVEQLLLEFDEQRERVLEDVFGLKANDNLAQYDIGLNKLKLNVDDCVESIVHLARRDVFGANDEGQRVLANLRLENAIRAAVCDLPEMFDLRSNITIETDFESGSVVISGVVGTRRVAAKIEDRALQVEGVTRLENRIVAKPVLV